MTKITFEKPILLSSKDPKQNFLIDSPLLNAKFDKGDTVGMEKWVLEIICTLKVSPAHVENDIEIFMEEDLFMMGLLPIKKIFIDKIANIDYHTEHLWYIRTNEFELDEFYNILELSIDDNLASCGKKRGGKTVGIYTSLSKL